MDSNKISSMSYLIASYPRSGSTYLRFIIANLFYPLPDVEVDGEMVKQEHDFHTVNQHIPAIDDVNNLKDCIDEPMFYKTHSLRFGQNIIHLHRHVGDVLISEYWYKQKFHKDDKTLYEFLIENNYGQNWRDSIKHYFPCGHQLSFDNISSGLVLWALPYFASKQPNEIQDAIDKSSFQKMQDAEEKGFGIYPTGDEEIKFCRKGTSNQWKELDEQTQNRLIEKNYSELKVLGYL